jgi:hypothetical protein
MEWSQWRRQQWRRAYPAQGKTGGWTNATRNSQAGRITGRRVQQTDGQQDERNAGSSPEQKRASGPDTGEMGTNATREGPTHEQTGRRATNRRDGRTTQRGKTSPEQTGRQATDGRNRPRAYAMQKRPARTEHDNRPNKGETGSRTNAGRNGPAHGRATSAETQADDERPGEGGGVHAAGGPHVARGRGPHETQDVESREGEGVHAAGGPQDACYQAN